MTTLEPGRSPSKLVGPFRLEGEVTKGFGRGSKELGIPTANFNETVVSTLPEDLQTGIYFGWTQLEDDSSEVRKAVVSIGWNPYYHNQKKSVETHVMHKYDYEFYGKWLKVLICGYLRPEKNYDSLQALIDDINADIRQAENSLGEDKFKNFTRDAFFTPIQNGSKM